MKMMPLQLNIMTTTHKIPQLLNRQILGEVILGETTPGPQTPLQLHQVIPLTRGQIQLNKQIRRKLRRQQMLIYSICDQSNDNQIKLINSFFQLVQSVSNLNNYLRTCVTTCSTTFAFLVFNLFFNPLVSDMKPSFD